MEYESGITQCAKDRLKDAVAMRAAALKKAAAAEANLAVLSRVSFSLIEKQIAKVEAEIANDLLEIEKRPRTAPRVKVEGVNALA